MSDTRSIRIDRTGKAKFRATNVRGGTIELSDASSGNDDQFTPIELLLVAIAGCTGIDVDYIAGKRAEPLAMSLSVSAEKVRDENGNHLTDITVSFDVTFPEGPEGDAAREVLPFAIAKSHDRLCTVSRTVMLPTTVTSTIGSGPI